MNKVNDKIYINTENNNSVEVQFVRDGNKVFDRSALHTYLEEKAKHTKRENDSSLLDCATKDYSDRKIVMKPFPDGTTFIEEVY